MRVDALVIGGGFYGCCLAIHLRRRFARVLLVDRADRLLTRASRGETGLVAGIGVFEQDMRDYVYPFMRMTMDHDRNFGGGALEQRG